MSGRYAIRNKLETRVGWKKRDGLDLEPTHDDLTVWDDERNVTKT